MICAWWNGSGEGQVDLSRCSKCKGLGEIDDIDTETLEEIF